MTIQELLNGIDYEIERSCFMVPKTILVPKKFLKKAHTKIVEEEHRIYKVKNTKGIKILEVGTKIDPISNKATEFYLEVNYIRQNCEADIMKQVFNEVANLYSEQEREKLHKETAAQQLKWEQKKNNVYRHLADEIKRIQQ